MATPLITYLGPLPKKVENKSFSPSGLNLEMNPCKLSLLSILPFVSGKFLDFVVPTMIILPLESTLMSSDPNVSSTSHQ